MYKELTLALGQRWRRRDGRIVVIDFVDKTADTRFPFRAVDVLPGPGKLAGWYNHLGVSVTGTQGLELKHLQHHPLTIPPLKAPGRDVPSGTLLPFFATAKCEEVSGELVCSFELNGKTYEGIAYPKPKSKKAQALALIDGGRAPEGDYLNDEALALIREVVETAPEDF